MKKIILKRPIHAFTGIAHIHPILQRIYFSRGIRSTKDLELDLKSLYSYESLSNINLAVSLLVAALQEQKHVLIIGDFDADGATSTVVALKALRWFGLKNVSYLVPNRFDYGYGLTPEIVEVAQQKKPDLVLTVDNGISSHQGVLKAKAL